MPVKAPFEVFQEFYVRKINRCCKIDNYML